MGRIVRDLTRYYWHIPRHTGRDARFLTCGSKRARHLSPIEDEPSSPRVDRSSRRRPAHQLLCAALLMQALASCAEGPEPSGPSQALADTLTALIEDAYDFSRPGAEQRMMALYEPTERVVSATGGELAVGADSVRAGIARFWELAGQNMRDARWTWGEVHVERLGPEAAVLTATWSLPHLTPAGERHVIEGAWTAVFRHGDRGWKIVHEHLSAPSG